jgi:hypothetical protein
MPYSTRPSSREQDTATFSAVEPIFSKGVASVPDARTLEEGQLAKCENAYIARSGRVRRRPGHSAVTGGTLASAARANRRFVSEDGAHFTTLVWSGTNIIDLRSGVAKTIKTDVAATGTIAHEVWSDAVYYSDGTNGLRKVTRVLSAIAGTLLSDMTAENANLTFTASTAGWAGNDISIAFVDPLGNNAALAITAPTAHHYVISLARGAGGAITSTANDIKTAVDADSGMNTHVTVAVEGTGVGLANALAAAHLSGGRDIDDYLDAAVSSTYSFTYLAKRANSERLFGISAADETDLRWCNALTPATWTATDVYSPGGRFIACGEVGDAFLAVTDEMCYRIDGSDPTTWDANPVQSDGLGCRAPRTFTVIEGIAVWWSVRGLAYFDGTRPKLLSEFIYDSKESDRCLVVTDIDCWPKMFAVNTGDHYVLYFPSEAAHDCDRAMVLDFRMQAWGGPYKFGFEATCGDANLRDDPIAVPILATSAKVLIEDATVYTDDSAAYTTLVRGRTHDGARRMLDKLYIDMRAVLNLGATNDVTFRFVAEDESSARSGATVTSSVATGEATLRKRLPNVRAESGFMEVEMTGNTWLEVVALAADLFFCRVR